MKFRDLSTILILTTLITATACKPSNGSAAANNHAASPFDTTHFETQALSADDRAKLAAANGKSVQPIEIEALVQRINGSTGRLHVYCFWNLKNAASVSTVRAVNELSAKFDTSKLKIVFVAMPGFVKIEDVNLFVREQQLTDETLILERGDVGFFSKKIRKDMTGIVSLPVVLLVNKADETLFFYNKQMDAKELTAIVQPLL